VVAHREKREGPVASQYISSEHRRMWCRSPFASGASSRKKNIVARPEVRIPQLNFFVAKEIPI
jgi:hypothetical protein